MLRPKLTAALSTASTYPLDTPRVSVMRRVAAKLIDLVIIMAVAGTIPYPVGPVMGFVYSLFADGIHYRKVRAQSFGKQVLKIRVIHAKLHTPTRWKSSALRNAPVGVLIFFALIPIWGWALLLVIGLPLLALEIYLMLSVESGQRLGDVMGDTLVVSAKSKMQQAQPQEVY